MHLKKVRFVSIQSGTSRDTERGGTEDWGLSWHTELLVHGGSRSAAAKWTREPGDALARSNARRAGWAGAFWSWGGSIAKERAARGRDLIKRLQDCASVCAVKAWFFSGG